MLHELSWRLLHLVRVLKHLQDQRKWICIWFPSSCPMAWMFENLHRVFISLNRKCKRINNKPLKRELHANGVLDHKLQGQMSAWAWTEIYHGWYICVLNCLLIIAALFDLITCWIGLIYTLKMVWLKNVLLFEQIVLHTPLCNNVQYRVNKTHYGMFPLPSPPLPNPTFQR